MQVSKWECPKAAPPTTTPAPLPAAPTSACPDAPAPWEAWWDEEEEMCYCWNAVTLDSTWDCPKLSDVGVGVLTIPFIPNQHTYTTNM
jgi:hypothetical protein